MDRAEERALEAYPVKMRYVGIDSVKDGHRIDVNKPMRERYIKAYHQAEKDLALTVEDISVIISIDQQVCSEYGILKYVVEHKKAMEEVLKRYLKSKKV